MGEILGSTEIAQKDSNSNRVYMVPTANSITYEPLSIASTIHKVLGVKNPEILTSEEKEIKELLVFDIIK